MAAGSTNDFDLIVLGAGTGGYSAAFRAAQLGMRVALVDQGKIGGTCLHVGCIPTKALLESAELFARLKKAGDFGIVLEGQPGFDIEVIARRRDQIVKRMWTGLKSLVDKNKVTWIAGRGRLDGATTVRVALNGEDGAPAGGPGGGGKQVLRAGNVIVATGSRVKSLPGLVPDGRRIITSDDVTTKADLPKSIAIVGAGAVGCEFASLYHDLGVAVTLLEYLPGIMPLEDRDVSQALERSFKRRGITVVTEGPLRHPRSGEAQGRFAESRSRRAPPRRSCESSSCSSRPAGRPTPRRSGWRRPRSSSSAGSSRSTAGCGPPSRTSTPSAT